MKQQIKGFLLATILFAAMAQTPMDENQELTKKLHAILEEQLKPKTIIVDTVKAELKLEIRMLRDIQTMLETMRLQNQMARNQILNELQYKK